MYVLLAGAILVGLGVALWGFIVLQKQRASYHWPATRGMIVHSERVYVPGGGSSSSSHYRADMTYSYKVNGTRYISHQISLWSADLSDYGDENKTFVANHPKGSVVDVYYDPGNPANAVLIPGAHEKLYKLLMGYGAFLVVVGTIGIIGQRRKEPRLVAVLNAPDAATRTVQIRKADIEKGLGALLAYLMIAMLFLVFGVAIILPTFLAGPSVLLEAPHRDNSWQYPWAGVCVAGFIVCLVIASRKSRSAECPVCRNTLNKRTFTTHQCSRCGTRIIFDAESVPMDPVTPAAAGAVAQKVMQGQGRAHHRTTIQFQLRKDRLADIAGFVAFPILFVWLWAGVEKRADQGGTVVMTVMFLMVGAMYYFVPDSLGKKSRHSSKKPSVPEKPGPYLVDSGIIFFAPVCLLAYCLYLTWQHQAVGKNGMIVMVICIPVALVLATYICKLRCDRATKLKVPEPPPFVLWTLFGLWLLGTFIWIVLVVWLPLKLRGNF